MSPVLNAFTVDVEDYFQVSAFADRVSTRDWDRFESRVVANTHRVLRLLDAHGVRGTFFVLGWVADRYPALVRDIDSAGHEIGCHSYWHRLIYDQTPEQFRADLRQALDAVGGVLGRPVTAYRAPSFSVTRRSLWALDVLIEEGVTLDSSIFPVRHDRYGIPDAERFPHRVERPAGTLVEVPPSTCRVAGVNLPVAGGGYFRMLPLPLTVRAIRRVNAEGGAPFVFYIHPWELDPDQPRLPGGFLSLTRHYQNVKSCERKLESLVTRLPFGSLGDSLRRSLPRFVPAADERTLSASPAPTVAL